MKDNSSLNCYCYLSTVIICVAYLAAAPVCVQFNSECFSTLQRQHAAVPSTPTNRDGTTDTNSMKVVSSKDPFSLFVPLMAAQQGRKSITQIIRPGTEAPDSSLKYSLDFRGTIFLSVPLNQSNRHSEPHWSDTFPLTCSKWINICLQRRVYVHS